MYLIFIDNLEKCIVLFIELEFYNKEKYESKGKYWD